MIAIVAETNREICRKWFHHDWPVDAPAGAQLAPYFGALLNLKAMREGNFTETFRRATEKWEMNEQLCASIAVNGRVKPAQESSNWLIWGYTDCNSSVRADLEWGAFRPYIVHWPTGAKPWNDCRLWGSQLWIRELTDWSELRHECAFRVRDQEKIPAIVLYVARKGVSCGSLPEDLEDSGFGVEMLRGCDPEIRFSVRDSVSLVLKFFKWNPCRHSMACVISHRWAWQHFLEQSDQPYAV